MMSNDCLKREPHLKCNACDFQKLKQLENNPAVRSLQDKIEQLSFRLAECRNEKQMLQRNLQLAKKMVFQEVGANDVDFQALMKHGTEEGKKGRQESILVLKKRVQELEEYLRELEGNPSDERSSGECVMHQMPNDKKRLWRMDLERRLARESAEKDINPLVQECFELRKTLDAEKSRFKELNDEVKLLEAELQSQVSKNEKDAGIVNSFKTLEKQLQETLAEKVDIRQDMEGCRNRNKRLAEEVESLKRELKVLQKRTSDYNALIESLTNSHKSTQESINVEKLIVQQNVDRYKEELERLMQNLSMDVDILDHLQNLMFDRSVLVDELKKDVDEGLRKSEQSKQVGEKGKKKVVGSKPGALNKLHSKVSKTAQPVSSKSREMDSPTNSLMKNSSMLDAQKMRLECAKYKILCQAANIESNYLLSQLSSQEKKMNDIAVRVVETGQLILQKNGEKKELLEKINRLQRSMSTTQRRRKQNMQPKSRLDEIRIKCDAQKQENDFLRNFLRSAVCSKAEDLKRFREYIAYQNHFLQESLDGIKKSPKTPEDDEISQRSMETVN